MATILIAWEMGTGIGHITRLRPIAEQLLRRGHRVYVAAREVGPCFKFFRDLSVPVMQAPIEPEPRSRTPTTETFAHILFNCGFAESSSIAGRVAAWIQLFDFIHPELVIADCSPTAMLAAHCAGIPRVAIGTGFECPPNVSPLPPLRRVEQRPTSDEIEQKVLANLSLVCRDFGAQRFEQFSELYYGCAAPVLLTYPEIDCYSERTDATYWGAVIFSNGLRTTWPVGTGPRVFAYLLDHEFTPAIMRMLAERGWPTLVIAAGNSVDATSMELPNTMQVADNPVDSCWAAQESDLTICYGGHGTICITLLAGKPLLILPTTVEQYLNGLAVTALGAGELGHVGNVQQASAALDRVTQYSIGAQRFAAKHAHMQPTAEIVSAHLERIS